MKTEQREAKRAYDAARYISHREEILAHQKAYNASHKEERRAYNVAYNSTHREEIAARDARGFAEFLERLQALRTVNGCEDCETHGGWLEHHHVDPATKLYNISEMYRYSLDALEEELEKCAVLCRSCHVTRHYAMKQEEAVGP